MAVQYDLVKEESFINPFNFVSVDFSESSREKTSEQSDDLLTGVINCTLTTVTPLAIPDVANIKNKSDEHKQYECMKDINGNPFIPGSSIRGVIRSVYETATKSCFITTDKKESITVRRETTRPLTPGVLRLIDGKWTLFECERYMLRVKSSYSNSSRNNPLVWDDKICPVYEVKTEDKKRYIYIGEDKKQSGDLISFDRLLNENGEKYYYQKKRNNSYFNCAPVATKIYSNLDKGTCKGILVLGEDIYNKHHESIFCCKKEPIRIVTSEEIEKLDSIIETYQNKGINKNYIDNLKKDSKGKISHYGYTSYEDMKKKGVIPIWYSCDENGFYFSPASIGRVALNKSVYNLLDKMQPCESADFICKACSLFGMIGKSSQSSKVRFTDAVCKLGNPIMGYYTLQELGSPRVSYMPFYSSSASGTYDDKGVSLRGRKFYWHSTDYLSHIKLYDKNRREEHTSRNSTIELIDRNKKFSFKVFFDKISDTQLCELIWSLNFWENECDENGEFKYCHKIGHGKPLGLGSSKIIVDSIETRRFNDDGYLVGDFPISYNSGMPFSVNENPVKELLEICTFVDERVVKYPYIKVDGNSNGKKENDTASHKWFTENKNGVLKNRAWNVQMLPSVEDICNRNERLHPFKLINEDSNNDSNFVKSNAVFTQGKRYTAKISGESKDGKKYFLIVIDDNGKKISRDCSALKAGRFFQIGDSASVEFFRINYYNEKTFYFFNFV